MVDHNVPMTISTPLTINGGSDRIVGTGALTVDGTTLTFTSGTIGIAGADPTTIINAINGGIIETSGSGTVILETDGGSSGRGNWGGISFGNAAHIIDDFEIRNARGGLADIEGTTAIFRDVVVTLCGGGSSVGVVRFTSAGGGFKGTSSKPNIIKNCDRGLSVTNPCDIDWITIENLAQQNAVNSIITGLVIISNITVNDQTFHVEIRGGELRVSNFTHNIVLASYAVPYVLVDFNTTSGGLVAWDGYILRETGSELDFIETQRFEITNSAAIVGTMTMINFDVIFFARNGVGDWFLDTTVDDSLTWTLLRGTFSHPPSTGSDGATVFGLEGFSNIIIAQIDVGLSDPTGGALSTLRDLGGAGPAGTVNLVNCDLGEGNRGTAMQIRVDRDRKYRISGCRSLGHSGFAPTIALGHWNFVDADVEIDNCRIDENTLLTGFLFVATINYESSPTSPSIRITNTLIRTTQTAGPATDVPLIRIKGDDADGSGGLFMRNTKIIHATPAFRPAIGIEIVAPGVGDGTVQLDLLNCVVQDHDIALLQDRRVQGLQSCNEFRDNDRGWKFVHATYSALQVFVNNNLIGNATFGVENTGAAQIEAILCYWNSIDGPGGVGPGSGDPVSAGVTFQPFAIVPCQIFGVIIGDIDLQDFILDPLVIEFTLNKAGKADFRFEDLTGQFTRGDFNGKGIQITFGGNVIFRGWVEIATPKYIGAGAREWRILALDNVSRGRISDTGTLSTFNYAAATDPAQIFRDTIDLALAALFPSENLTHTAATIPDSTELLIADFRETPILDIWNVLLQSVPGRAFWIDSSGVVYFREVIASAEVLDESEVDEMENPSDLGDTYNAIRYRFDDLTDRVLPIPLDVTSILENGGVRTWVQRDPDETDPDSAKAKADTLLASRSGVLEEIPAKMDLELTRFFLWEDITIDVPIMELDGVTRRVTAIRHEIHLLSPAEDSSVIQGETHLTLGSIPARVSDILQSVLL